eukprot:6191329-Pleurochrysis_carterae.AAC.4
MQPHAHHDLPWTAVRASGWRVGAIALLQGADDTAQPVSAAHAVAMSPSYWLRSGAGKEAAEAVGKRELIARTAGANSTATAAATAAVLRSTFPEKCSRLKQARCGH